MSANASSADSQSLTNAGRFETGGPFQPSTTSSPEDFASPAAVAEQGESLDARLMRRLLSSLGNPPIEFHFLWSGERVAPHSVRPVEHVRIADRRTLLGLV